MPNKFLKLNAIVLAMVYLTACSNAEREKNNLLSSIMEEGFEGSNGRLVVANQKIEHELSRRAEDPDPSLRDIAIVWQDRANQVSKLSAAIYAQIDELKSSLAKSATDEAVNEIIMQQGKGNELYKLLRQYKDDMLRIDTELNAHLEAPPMITTASFDSSKQGKDFAHTFFSGISNNMARAILSKFQNNIRRWENEMLMSCFYKTNVLICIPSNRFQLISTIDKVHVSAGETLEINAGIVDGSFYAFADPIITINGKTVENAVGFVTTTIKADGKPGKHTLPVKISYKSPNTGQRETISKDITYYVDSIPAKP